MLRFSQNPDKTINKDFIDKGIRISKQKRKEVICSLKAGGIPIWGFYPCVQ